MKRVDKELLLEPFNVSVEEVLVRGNRLLLRTGQAAGAGQAYTCASWDRYFTDLSFGSYTPLADKQRRIGRDRVWHFAFKNLAIVRRILAYPDQQVRILDIGCSTGYFRRFLEGNVPARERKTLYYWGLDIREDALRSATIDTSSIESGAAGNRTPSAFVAHDAGDSLPFEPDSFDFVLNFEMIKYLPLGVGQHLLAESRRVMRPGAMLALSMPTSFEYYRQTKPGYMTALEPNEVIDVLEQSGLAVENVCGSQTQFAFLKDAIEAKHLHAFHDLLAYHPPEIVAAIFAPLYPEYSTGLTYFCTRQR